MSGSKQRSWWLRYAIAIVSIALVALLRWLLDPVLGEKLPYLMFLLGVAATAWLADVGPAVLALALGWIAADFFFGVPRFSMVDIYASDWVESLIFVTVGLGFIAICHTQQLASRRGDESRREAAAANSAKDKFIAVLSHELRTPLTPVLLASSWLEMQPGLSAEIRTTLEMMRHNIELEARLIDDLLEISRITRDKMQLHREIVDLHQLLARALATCQSDLAGHGLTLTQSLQANPSHIDADPVRLEQVLWNLLKNAVKFTPSGGQIALRSRNDDAGNVLLEVSDTGIGIDPDSLARIFDPFEQGGSNVTRRFGGLGLGLAISRGIVQLHGGRIAAHSPGPGQGSTFTLSLPAATRPAPSPRPLDGQPREPSTHPISILLVEDHAGTAQIMDRLLSHLGHHVTVATSVAGALECLVRQQFDLLISDLGLPDASGYDLMRQARRSRQLPGIALSGYGMDADIRKSLEAGFAEHLTKPVDLRRLIGSIDRAVRPHTSPRITTAARK